jgi:hypothetical protein
MPAAQALVHTLGQGQQPRDLQPRQPVSRGRRTPYLQEGEIAVIEPLGSGQFRIVARIAKSDWKPLGAP